MRLGLYPAKLVEGSLVRELYGQPYVEERHRHRYEVNNDYRSRLEDAGLRISGTSPDGRLVEFVELPIEMHPFFVATQAHPELRSRPTRPHPLFAGLIAAALRRHDAADRVDGRRGGVDAPSADAPEPTSGPTPRRTRSTPGTASRPAGDRGRSGRRRPRRSSTGATGHEPTESRVVFQRQRLGRPPGHRRARRRRRTTRPSSGSTSTTRARSRSSAWTTTTACSSSASTATRSGATSGRRRPGCSTSTTSTRWWRPSASSLEEAHQVAETWHVLYDVYNSPGSSSEALRCYLARDVRPADGERYAGSGEERDMPTGLGAARRPGRPVPSRRPAQPAHDDRRPRRVRRPGRAAGRCSARPTPRGPSASRTVLPPLTSLSRRDGRRRRWRRCRQPATRSEARDSNATTLPFGAIAGQCCARLAPCR